MNTTGPALYAWRSLLLVPVAGVLVAVKGLVTGAPSNPMLVQTLTGLGLEELRTQQPGVVLLLGVLKRHESLALLGWAFWLAWSNVHSTPASNRWVWYGWWTVPVLIAAFGVTGAGVRSGMRLVLLGLIGLTIVCLWASRPAVSSDRSP